MLRVPFLSADSNATSVYGNGATARFPDVFGERLNRVALAHKQTKADATPVECFAGRRRSRSVMQFFTFTTLKVFQNYPNKLIRHVVRHLFIQEHSKKVGFIGYYLSVLLLKKYTKGSKVSTFGDHQAVFRLYFNLRVVLAEEDKV